MTGKREARFHSGKFGSAISVQVKPGAMKNSVKEIRPDGLVVVRLTCKSGDESSNPFLLQFLSGLLEVDQSNLDIVAGGQGDYKIISILGIDSQRLEELLIATKSKQS